MVSVLILGKARGVKSSAIPALALAVGFLILIDPFEAIDPGFALSVVATAGILLFASPIAQWLNGYLHNLRIAQLLAIPLSANLLCTPIAIAISGQFSLMSLPSNLLVEPMVAPITIVGFVAALFTSLSPGLAYLLILSQRPFAAEIVWVAHTCSRVPVVHLSGGFLGAGIGLLATMMVWIAIRWRSWA
jgi:competence protein ComEC